MKRAVIYLRVSTIEQTTENQRQELVAVAARRGWQINHVYEDLGVSGSATREKRPAYDQMLKDAARAKFDVILAWDVSRLGRSLVGLVQALDDLNALHIDLYLHQQALDTTTPSGRAMFQMCGVFAEFERSMISERVRAGLRRAKQAGAVLGRPQLPIDPEALRVLVASGSSVRNAASRLGISVGSAHKAIKQFNEEDRPPLGPLNQS